MLGKIKNVLTHLVWKYLPACRDVTALISRAMENDLSWRERLVMRTHLYTCLACRRYLAQLEFMDEVFQRQERKLEKGELPARLGSEASERLKNALKSSKLLLCVVLLNCY